MEKSIEKNLKSICLMIRKDQHDRLQEMGVNVSGFVRDMIDDRLSEETIILNVTPDTRALYDQIVSTSPGGDVDLEPYLVEALKNKLKDHILAMQKLHDSLKAS